MRLDRERQDRFLSGELELTIVQTAWNDDATGAVGKSSLLGAGTARTASVGRSILELEEATCAAFALKADAVNPILWRVTPGPVGEIWTLDGGLFASVERLALEALSLTRDRTYDPPFRTKITIDGSGKATLFATTTDARFDWANTVFVSKLAAIPTKADGTDGTVAATLTTKGAISYQFTGLTVGSSYGLAAFSGYDELHSPPASATVGRYSGAAGLLSGAIT